jgi:hypothetical protein
VARRLEMFCAFPRCNQIAEQARQSSALIMAGSKALPSGAR